MRFFGKTGIAVLGALMVYFAALPVSHAQSRSLYSFQTNSGGSYLGIEMEDVTAENMSNHKLASETGVIVRSVQTGSPASEANVKENDVILEYAGEKVRSAAQLSRLVQETPEGRKVDLAVIRDGKRIALTAKIGTRERRRSDYDSLPDNFGQLFRALPFRGPNSRDFDFNDNVPPRKPRLGVELQPVTEQLGTFLGVPGKKGALVSSVLDGSPSAGKLKSGDVIVQANGTAIDNPEDLTQIVRDKSEGEMTLKVIRDKKEITVTLSLPSNATEGDKGGIKL